MEDNFRMGFIRTSSTRQRAKCDKSKIACVSFVQADIQRLWDLEEMPGQHHSGLSCFLNFPVKRKDGSYEVGLLWKGNQRPGDNYDQAVHQLEL